LFNTSLSLDAGTAIDLPYFSGSVDGEVYWDQVALGPFGITFQAFGKFRLSTRTGI